MGANIYLAIILFLSLTELCLLKEQNVFRQVHNYDTKIHRSYMYNVTTADNLIKQLKNYFKLDDNIFLNVLTNGGKSNVSMFKIV